jgi:hypothetical protein
MPRTRSVTAGYVVLGLLGLSDALGFLLAGSGDDAPPVVINLIGTVLGLATLYGLFVIFRARGQAGPAPRPMVLTVVVSRILSALLGIPAFFADISAGVKVVVAVSIVLTGVGLVLVRPELAETSPGGAAPAPA